MANAGKAEAAKTFNAAIENGGNMTQAMKAGGYTESSAKKAYRLSNSDTWKELCDRFFPDESLAMVHKKFLEKKEGFVYRHKNGQVEYIKTDQPHTDALKALEIAYKLKGYFKTEQKDSGVIRMVEVFDAIHDIKKELRNEQSDDQKLIEGTG